MLDKLADVLHGRRRQDVPIQILPWYHRANENTVLADTKAIQDQIKILQPEDFDTPEELAGIRSLIRVLNQEGENPKNRIVITVDDAHDYAVAHPGYEDALASLYITSQTNREAASIFVSSLRPKMKDLIAKTTISSPTHSSYNNGEWFSGSDLFALAQRWQLPMVFYRSAGTHWVLCLRAPERTAKGWRVLTYNPTQNNEEWMDLSKWSETAADPDEIFKGSQAAVYANELAVEMLKNKSYDLSLSGDQELADHPELYAAKQTKVQFNAEDCGPLCLYATALRWAMKPEWNEFKFSGRDILQQDTGLKIRNRAEVFGK